MISEASMALFNVHPSSTARVLRSSIDLEKIRHTRNMSSQISVLPEEIRVVAIFTDRRFARIPVRRSRSAARSRDGSDYR